ncbi:MAG: glycerate kinase [Deltaproteobacteria bacterium]|jgi:glycerate kinase|nr:glycerate kinase [Deltaproteobacteria bacterium]
MKIVIAPDSFKGSLTALQAALAIKRGLVNVWPDAEYLVFPVSDGGVGTVEALVYLTGGTTFVDEVKDSLGRKIKAAWGLLGDGKTAVVEIASACGLMNLSPKDLDPARACTYGFGQQIQKALEKGIDRLILGLGGSATNDAGAGMLEALGLKLLKADGTPIERGAHGLGELFSIDSSGLNPRLGEVEITVACAVKNPLLGPKGTSQIFGPKKGATNLLIPELDKALAKFHEVGAKHTGRSADSKPGAGAAGGVGAALMLFTEATFVKGIEVVLKEGRFAEKAAGASLIIAGEGTTDQDTLWWGKAPLGVSDAGRAMGIPTITIAGALEVGYQKLYDGGMAAVMGVIPYPMSYPQAIGDASRFLEDAAWRLARILTTKLADAGEAESRPAGTHVEPALLIGET